MLPVFSKNPWGEYSSTSSTFVRSSSSLWKGMTPFVLPLAPSDVQATRLAGTAWVPGACHPRLAHQILARQFDLVSSVASPLSIPFITFETPCHCVHWS